MTQWRNDQRDLMEKKFGNKNFVRDFDQQHHSEIDHRNCLLVSLGDSWTWGDSLDPATRLSEIYGSRMAKSLKADWINCGAKGYSNSYILETLDFLYDHLKNTQYKKIYIVVTLTENGRDIDAFPHFDFDFLELFAKQGSTSFFYQTLLDEIEQYWIDQIEKFISKIDQRFTLIVGTNFVWHHKLLTQLQTRCIVLNQNWIECLADAQQMPRPIRTNIVTGFVFPKFQDLNKRLDIKDCSEYQKWIIPYLDNANKVNTWLDSSPMNHKKASKHPNAEGHRVWADYILQYVNNKV